MAFANTSFTFGLIGADLVCITRAKTRPPWEHSVVTLLRNTPSEHSVGTLRRNTGGSFWTNRAEAHGQLVLSPMRLPEQLRSSR